MLVCVSLAVQKPSVALAVCADVHQYGYVFTYTNIIRLCLSQPKQHILHSSNITKSVTNGNNYISMYIIYTQQLTTPCTYCMLLGTICYQINVSLYTRPQYQTLATCSLTDYTSLTSLPLCWALIYIAII